MTEVSLGKALYLRKKDSDAAYKKNDLVGSYNHRPKKYEEFSLEKYFYEVFRTNTFYKDEVTKRDKYRILVPKGLNCRPQYPPSYEYARGMLVMHKPWSVRRPLGDLLKDKELTVKTFLQSIGNRQFPLYVLAEYNRAVTYSQQYKHECLQKEGTHSGDGVDLSEMTAEEIAQHEHWEHSRHLSAQNERKSPNRLGENLTANIGLDHNWLISFFKEPRAQGIRRGECYTDYLKEVFYGDKKGGKLQIPLKKRDDSEYQLRDLNFEQQAVVICAIDSIIKFLKNDPTYKPFRATVVGCGGTGKSFIINTLISIVRQYTQCNETVKVAAPSGGAAYNVQGCTLHRALKLSVNSKKLCEPLSEDKQIELSKELKRLLMMIVDERSMLNSQLIAGAERNLRHCIYGQQNQRELWGGIPVVIIFGDDYQLMPVSDNGAIQGYALQNGYKDAKATKKTPNQQLMEEIGHNLFIDNLAMNVFTLRENYRTINDPHFGNILSRLRLGKASRTDAERLMKQCLHSHSKENREKIENDPKTVWLYTRNHEKNTQNITKLVEHSNRVAQPIARLQCQWMSNRCQSKGKDSVRRSHFKNCSLVLQTDLCVGAPVAISGINIVPEAGLYNGARGWVIDIVYDTVEGPNNKHKDHLPRYVVVDFPGLRLGNADPWDPKHPTVSTGYLKPTLQYDLILIKCHQFIFKPSSTFQLQ